MPVMDGIALALAAARDFPDLKILLMTGFADQRERASGLNAIVHDVVTKPFSVADIRTAVADALAARKTGSSDDSVAAPPSCPRIDRASSTPRPPRFNRWRLWIRGSSPRMTIGR